MNRVAHNKKTDVQYRQQVREIHGNRVKPLEVYVNDGFKINHICLKKHVWSVLPNSILQGRGCPYCANIDRGLKRRKTQTQYVSQVHKIHSGSIEVLGTYQGAFVKIRHKCKRCTYVWSVSPDNVTNTSKTGCPRCVKGVKSSKKATRWLREEARKRGIRIRHADNWGEYKIPGTRMQVDGFHKPTNTIFEFHGDCFHGNPKRYTPRQKCHPFSNKTAGRLYKETLAREELLRSMGYTVISIWESDYDSQSRKS